MGSHAQMGSGEYKMTNTNQEDIYKQKEKRRREVSVRITECLLQNPNVFLLLKDAGETTLPQLAVDITDELFSILDNTNEHV